MKGFRFYEEFKNKRKGISTGNCVAVYLENDGHAQFYRSGGWSLVNAVVAITDDPNSDVLSDSVSREFLSDDCKRVSEKRAREIHPRLIEYCSYNPKL